jgi:hypothetical protein
MCFLNLLPDTLAGFDPTTHNAAGGDVTTWPRHQGQSGANPTIASYNASVVKFYNAMGSLARFENKNIIIYF